MILDGWHDAIMCGRYAAVRYDCASESVARWINRLATKVRLPTSVFGAGVQLSAGQIAALSPAAPEDEQPVDDQQPSGDRLRERQETGQTTPGRAPASTEPVSLYPETPEAPPAPQPETAEAVAARDRLYREIFGLTEPKARRRWRR